MPSSCESEEIMGDAVFVRVRVVLSREGSREKNGNTTH